MEALQTRTLTSAKALLEEVVQHTLESLFFVEAVPIDGREAARIDGTEGLEVMIVIKGAFSGEIFMSLSRESACRLISQTLNVAGEVTNELLADAFAETLNTIGGRVAAALARANETFDLSIPTVTFGKLAASGQAPVKCCFQVEYGRICFSIFIGTLTPSLRGAP